MLMANKFGRVGIYNKELPQGLSQGLGAPSDDLL